MVRYEPLLIGALGAYLLFCRHALFERLAFHPITKVTLGILLPYMLLYENEPYIYIKNIIVALLFTLLVINISKRPLALLENKAINYLGKISFGLYVLHPVAIVASIKALQASGVIDISLLVFNSLLYVLIVTFSIVLASLSHKYFEAWFARRRGSIKVEVKAFSSN